MQKQQHGYATQSEQPFVLPHLVVFCLVVLGLITFVLDILDLVVLVVLDLVVLVVLAILAVRVETLPLPYSKLRLLS